MNKAGELFSKMSGKARRYLEKMDISDKIINRLFSTSSANGYGTNVVRLVVSNGYVSRLLDSDPIADYLERHHGELLTQLQNLTRTLAIEAGESEGIQRGESAE
ncbi:MAG: hypothetical protein GY927_24025 [bacterium]|nr:hypothetical protein [bacterium]